MMSTQSHDTARIGVIGGSGLYQMPEIEDRHAIRLQTPFGSPSAEIVLGTLRGRRIAFIPRHGIGHVFTPSRVPYRANIYALKMLGVRFIVAVNACGSLREQYAPGHIVIPDQLVDHTRADRGRTFFDAGIVAHISVADPFSPELSAILAEAGRAAGATVHEGGRFLTVEGPRFSTRGESHIFRAWGCDIIGMTTCPEAFLAREAEIAYATMAHVTDYDVWHEAAEPVTVEMVSQTMHHNLTIAQRALAEAVARIDEAADWPSHHVLDHAIMTAPSQMQTADLTALSAIIGRLSLGTDPGSAPDSR
jgi:5'-methylthioadenosine phosphorylase